MELAELALSNFKRFAEGRFAFCPGLNLIWGPNESGKSTVHEAIQCALFGRERGRSVENWDGGTCVAELTYRSDGKTYRIERRLTEGVSKLGVVDGGDLADVVTDKDRIAALISEHLGISSRAVFDNTVSIRQMNVTGPGAGEMEAVGGEIQRVLTGTAHVSADDARGRLEAARDDIKGRARPANPRESDRIADRLEKLAIEVADARESRGNIRGLEEEQDDLDARIGVDSERSSALEGLLERHRRWSELTREEAESDALYQTVSGSLRRIKETVGDMGLVQKELVDHTELIGKDEELADHLTKNATRREDLQARLVKAEGAGGGASASGRRASAVFLGAGLVLILGAAAAGVFANPWTAAVLLIGALVSVAIGLAMRYIRAISIRAGGPGELAESIRTELAALDADEQSLLTFMKCADSDRAWAKIKAYRNLLSRSRDSEVALKAHLSGRKVEDWEAQEGQLFRELSDTRKELKGDFAGYSPTTEESESWRSEYAALQDSLPRAQARLHEVKGSLETEKKNARDLAALDGELEYLHMRKAELEFAYRAYDEAISALAAVTQSFSEEYLPALSERASACLARITSGRYTSVCVKPGWEITADCRDRSEVKPTALSVGTLDQLYFALRLGCGELLSSGKRLPLILDDPFASFDRRRLDRALEMLKTIARENQVLLLSHDPHILDWAREAKSSKEIQCLIHELPAPKEQP